MRLPYIFALAALPALAIPAWAAITTVVQSGQAFSESDVTLKVGDHLKFFYHLADVFFWVIDVQVSMTFH